MTFVLPHPFHLPLFYVVWIEAGGGPPQLPSFLPFPILYSSYSHYTYAAASQSRPPLPPLQPAQVPNEMKEERVRTFPLFLFSSPHTDRRAGEKFPQVEGKGRPPFLHTYKHNHSLVKCSIVDRTASRCALRLGTATLSPPTTWSKESPFPPPTGPTGHPSDRPCL